MPRKSRAALSMWFPHVEPPSTPLRPRADAPAEVKEIFAALVQSVPPNHLRHGDVDLLELYAQSIALARRAYDELEANGQVLDGKASPWLVVLEKSHRSAVALSARLRLAPQMRTDPKVTGRSAAGWRPSAYELEAGDDQAG